MRYAMPTCRSALSVQVLALLKFAREQIQTSGTKITITWGNILKQTHR